MGGWRWVCCVMVGRIVGLGLGDFFTVFSCFFIVCWEVFGVYISGFFLGVSDYGLGVFRLVLVLFFFIFIFVIGIRGCFLGVVGFIEGVG